MPPRVRYPQDPNHPEEQQPVQSIEQFNLITHNIADNYEPITTETSPNANAPEPHAVEVADDMVKLSGEREHASYDPTRRVSEAAEDQGWGPIVRVDLPSRPKQPKKIRPYTNGPTRGESEGEVSGPDEDWRHTKVDKTIGLTGLAGLRVELHAKREAASKKENI